MKAITLLKSNGYWLASYYCDDERMRYSTGVKAEDVSDSGQLKLDRIDEEVLKYVTNHRDILEKPVLKQELIEYLDKKFKPDLKKKVVKKTFFQDCEFLFAEMRAGRMVKKKSRDRYSEESIKHFEGIARKLKKYGEDTGFVFTYDFSLKDLEKLLLFLISKNASRNYIFNIVNGLKWLLTRTLEAGFHPNKVFEHEDFNYSSEEKDAIALNLAEIEAIYRTEFKSEARNRARDLFVWGCFVGLRIKDLSRTTEYHLKDGQFEFSPSKTSNPILIPVHWIAQEIYDKYNGRIPIFKRGAFRLHLPDMAEAAGIKGMKLVVKTIGGVKIKAYHERWELVMPHTMRRSFATFMRMELKFEPEQIMPITGHTTVESFYKYIKVEKEENVKQILAHPAFKKPLESSPGTFS